MLRVRRLGSHTVGGIEPDRGDDVREIQFGTRDIRLLVVARHVRLELRLVGIVCIDGIRIVGMRRHWQLRERDAGDIGVFHAT